MILINKIIKMSGAQFYSISSVYCIVCSPPQIRVEEGEETINDDGWRPDLGW